MNKLQFLIVCMGLMGMQGCQSESTKIIFRELPFPTGYSLVVSDSLYHLSLDSTCSGSLVLENFRTGYLTLKTPLDGKYLFLEQGHALTVRHSYHDVVRWTYTGYNAAENVYLNAHKLEGPDREDYRLQEGEFLQKVKKWTEKNVSYVDSLKLSPVFTKLEHKRVACIGGLALIRYLQFNPDLSKLYSPELSQESYDYLEQLVKDDEKLWEMDWYRNFLYSVVPVLALRRVPEGQEFQKLEAGIAARFKSPVITENLIHHYLMGQMKLKRGENLDLLRQWYEAYVTHPKLMEQFKAVYRQWAALLPGKPSPSFTYKNMNDEEVSLESFRGKYVYIDVWATWCNPCCKQLPYLFELEKRMEGCNIAFVSLSVDQDVKAWKEKVEKEKMPGIQLNTADDKTFTGKYRITGIPHFILLDKQGNILKAMAPWPYDPQTEELLRSLPGI